MNLLTGELELSFRRISWSFSIILFRKFARCDLLAAPLLGHPDGQFSITGNRIFTKFGILLYLDTPTTPWGHPCPNADIGLMLPSHVSHSQKLMIQFGAVGNKSFESRVTLPTGDFPNSLIMNGTRGRPCSLCRNASNRPRLGISAKKRHAKNAFV